MKNSTFIKRTSLLLVGLLVGFSFATAGVTIETTPLSETFATSLGSFTNQSVTGTQVWGYSSFSGTGFAKMSGYASSANNENEDWLISPSVDLAGMDSAILSFNQANYYKATSTIADEQTVWISSDYVSGLPSTGTWTKLTIPNYQTALSSYTFLSSGNMYIPAAFLGKKVTIAFKYISTTTTSSTWEVKDVVLKGYSQPKQTVVFKETFDKMGNTSKAPGSEITSAKWDEVADNAGWSSTKAYPAGGKVKMGSSSAAGILTTPAMNLASNNGTFSFSFKAMAWSGDTTNLIVSINDVPYTTIKGMNADTFYILKDYGPFEVTTGTGSTKITFSSKGGAKNCRFFIDSLVVTQSEATDPKASIVPLAFKSEAGKTQNQDLALTAANLTGDLTIALTNIKGQAFSTTTTTVTKANAIAGFNIPVVYAPTAAGLDTATITISGGGLAASVVVKIAGSAYTPVVANLAALRAAYIANPDPTIVYTVTGEVVTNYYNTTTTSYTAISAYLQDATGGVMLYDRNGKFTTPLAIGDGVTGLTGTLTEYGKVLELLPTENKTVSSTGATLIPVELTVSQAKAQKERFESVLVCVKNLTNAGSATVWSASKANYNFASGTDTIVLRTNFAELDYMVGGATPILTTAANYAGVLIEYNGAVQIFPRKASDLGYTGAVQGLHNTSVSAKVYGANGVLNVQASQGQIIEVYNLMGVRVARAIANEGNNTFSLNHNQLYLVKVGSTTAKVVL